MSSETNYTGHHHFLTLTNTGTIFDGEYVASMSTVFGGTNQYGPYSAFLYNQSLVTYSFHTDGPSEFNGQSVYAYTPNYNWTLSSTNGYYGDWIQFKLPNNLSVKVTNIGFVVRPNTAKRMPVEGGLFGSNDYGNTWTAINASISQNPIANYNISTNTYYNVIRFVCYKIAQSNGYVFNPGRWNITGVYLDSTTNQTVTTTIPNATVNYNSTIDTNFVWVTNNFPATTLTIESAADVAPPAITVLGSPVVTIQYGATYTDAGATAVDETDGSLTSSIVTTNPVNTNAVGTYTIAYNVSDAAGNAATTKYRTVYVVDTVFPIITLVGASSDEIKVGDSYTDAGATATDNVDGDITANIVTTGSVDINTAGTYTITFNVSDNAGNAATPVTRTIVVSAVPEVVIEESKPTVDVTSISIVPVAANATAATKRAFTKNAVRNMFSKIADQIGNKPVKLAAGSALPGFSEAVAEDVFLYDTRYKTTFEKTEMLNKTFYLASDTNDTITLPTINNSLTVTQNTDDFTIVTPESTVTKVSGDTFIYGGLTLIFGSVYGYLQSDVICFNRGTKITCMNPDTKDDMEVPVEQLREGMYVKTYKHGYIRMKQLASKMIENPETDERSQNRLYICEPGDSFPELTEPLIMTGCHAILVDQINDMQHKTMVELLGSLFLTDEKVRLMCMYDERVYPYCQAGEYEVWHVCLDHYDPNMNYGIYANGLLVESCSERNIYLSSLQKM